MGKIAMSRRRFTGIAAGALFAGDRTAAAQDVSIASDRQQFSLPIGWPDRTLGDGFIILHGYACENTWYNPGNWHTGEDWYALDGAETAGALIVAIGDGTVVYVGSDYPGRVVIVQHEGELFSMYGHLGYEVSVAEGDTVKRGERLGTVLLRTDGRVPSHLHFEVRTFLMTPEVNGGSPRYGFSCGYECPPGPGYWPIDAPEHPSAMGWRNPLEFIAQSISPADDVSRSAVVAVGATPPTLLWSLPSDREDAQSLGAFALDAGDELQFLGVSTRDPASTRNSAEAYRIWYSIALPDDTRGWIQAVIPDDGATGSDGRPSSVRLQLLPLD